MQIVEYRRQFVIAQGGTFVPPGDWLQRRLQDGWVLHHQRDLDVAEHRAADGRDLVILGNAYCLETVEDGGTGRYAVIDWPYVYGDRAGALLSLFHCEENGAFVVSSNAGLVAAALRGADEPDYRHGLKHRSKQNYVPAPGSRYRGVRRLLRDQRIDLPGRRVEFRPNPVLPLASYGDAVATVAGELAGFARDLRARTKGRVFLQLTAGLDSRTIAAAFKAAGIEFETVTFRGPAKPETDITVAARISRALGVRHNVMDPEPRRAGVADAYGRITSGALNGWDLTDVFPGNIYRFAGRDDTVVGGACLELGRQKFAELFGELTLETATGAALWQRLAGEPGPSDFTAFLDQWLAWRRAHPYPLNLVASHYLDQRIGAWAATGMQGYDLIEGRCVHPANNPRIFSALVTPSEDDQVAGKLQYDVIGTLAPELLAFPLNPLPLGRRMRRLAGHAKRAARGVLVSLTGGRRVAKGSGEQGQL